MGVVDGMTNNSTEYQAVATVENGDLPPTAPTRTPPPTPVAPKSQSHTFSLWLLVFVVSALLFAAFGAIAVVVAVFHGKQESDVVSSHLWTASSASQLGLYAKAAVATDNVFCSEIGRDVLISGGNAVDAAVASLVCIGVMNPHSAGLGGGHFMTIYNARTGKCACTDARERAPLAASRDMYGGNRKLAASGWLAIAVPGELAGLWHAYTKHGSGQLTWTQLLQPTIELMRRGIVVSQPVANAIQARRSTILADNSSMSIFFNPATGDVYREGEVMHRPALQRTLSQLANAVDPQRLFYNGSIAAQIVDEFSRNGAIITGEDLASYAVVPDASPIAVDLPGTGLGVCGPQPPSGSALVMSIMQTVNAFGISPAANLSTIDQVSRLEHRFIEAMKFAYARRQDLADADYVPRARPTAELIASADYGRQVRDRIRASPQPPAYYNEELLDWPEDHGTSHVTVVDAQGNAVAATTTINAYFGASVRSESTGIIWNDEMDDFALPDANVDQYGLGAEPVNYIEPGKRPASSMAPVVFYDTNTRQVRLALGGAGGSRIISGVAYVAMRALYFNETLKQAVDAHRLHDQLNQGKTIYEDEFPQVILDKLASYGHNMSAITGRLSVVTAVSRTEDGSLTANSDHRKGPTSEPAGY